MNTDQRLHGLDHLRAFAIIAVLFYHYGGGIFDHHPAWLESVSQFGWSGVDLFFVLSGYLIGGQLLRSIAEGRGVSLRGFFIQRFFRIMPVYWVVLALYFSFPALIERSHLPPLWRFLTFTQNFGLGEQEGLAFSQVWSLCIEGHFYLLFPAFIAAWPAWRWRKTGFWFAGLLMVGSCALRAYLWMRVEGGQGHWYGSIYYPTYSHLDGLVVGVSIAAIFVFCPQQRGWLQRYSYGCLAVGLALLCVAGMVCAQQRSLVATLFGFPLFALGFGAIVIAALSPNCFLYYRASTITQKIAILSYSMYLIHKIVVHVVQGSADAMNIDVDGVLMLVLCMLCTFLAAWLLHAAVEHPFLVLRDRLAERRF